MYNFAFNLELAEFFSTCTACCARNKYQVCAYDDIFGVEVQLLAQNIFARKCIFRWRNNKHMNSVINTDNKSYWAKFRKGFKSQRMVWKYCSPQIILTKIKHCQSRALWFWTVLEFQYRQADSSVCYQNSEVWLNTGSGGRVETSGGNLYKKSCRAITINKRQPRLIGN